VNNRSDLPPRRAKSQSSKPRSGSDSRTALRATLDATGAWTWWWIRALVCGFTAGLVVAASEAAEKPGKEHMQLTSTAFAEGAPIPAKYTGDEKDLSPPLKWTGVPAGTKSLALIADDPDAPVGTWVHWVLYDLAPTTTELPEDVAKSQYVAGGAKQGQNDFRRLGYGGPAPPPGKAHRYFFKLYALDKVLELKPGATKKEVERAMEKHILAQAQLMGTYQRK
jgi:Raf kinase inhibitor-like YbhB/YbcL family protein